MKGSGFFSGIDMKNARRSRKTGATIRKTKLLLSSVAVLMADGAVAVRGQSVDDFDPNANGRVHVVVVQPWDQKILIGGEFTTVAPNGGTPVTRNLIARLNPDGTLDNDFNPNASGDVQPTVYAIAVQAADKILVGGGFTNIGGQPRTNLARLDAKTGLADSFNANPSLSNAVVTIAMQPDNKILIGGNFAGGMRRLNTNGTSDGFAPNANNIVNAIVVQTDGQILVGGGFTSIGGQTRNGIARLDATTGLAYSFNLNANPGLESIALQTDGKILAGGLFTTIGGQARKGIARLTTDGMLDTAFDPNADGASVFSIVVQPDGQILVAGSFSSIGGQARNGIARLDATTGLADSFDPSPNSSVDSIAVQADGKILLGGNFMTLNPGGGPASFTRNHIARLIPASATPTATVTATATATATATPKATATATSTGTPSPTPMPTPPPPTPPCGQGLTRTYYQYFDGVTPPVLPAGWVATNAVNPDGILWVTSDSGAPPPPADSAPNAAFSNDPGSISDKRLDSPSLGFIMGPAQLWFRNNYSLEANFDGGVLEISTDNGATFSDIVTLGGSFVAGGYNATISTSFGSPIAGRMAWSGSSGGFITTVVDLPLAAWGHTVKLRWRMASDNSVSDAGWRIDNVQFFDSLPTPAPTVGISGTVTYCTNPSLPPIPGVTMTLSGSANATTTTDGSGNYSFSGLTCGFGNYTVTPTKAALPPGANGITTTDVIAVQRHFLIIGPPLTGCKLAAADVNGVGGVNTIDVIAIQRFFLTLTTGIANVGKYQFNPVSRSYSPITGTQTGQNYDAIVFGDVATSYVH
jgi:uncharacterized delta-60 repeat protein